MSAEEQSHHATPEPPDIAGGPVLAFSFGFMIFAAVAAAGLYLYFRQAFTSPMIASPRAFPLPELQQDPSGDLEHLLGAQRRRLASYAWIDKAAGTIRIPISEAMRLIAAKGPDGLAPLELPAVTPTPGGRGGAPAGPERGQVR